MTKQSTPAAQKRTAKTPVRNIKSPITHEMPRVAPKQPMKLTKSTSEPRPKMAREVYELAGVLGMPVPCPVERYTPAIITRRETGMKNVVRTINSVRVALGACVCVGWGHSRPVRILLE